MKRIKELKKQLGNRYSFKKYLREKEIARLQKENPFAASRNRCGRPYCRLSEASSGYCTARAAACSWGMMCLSRTTRTHWNGFVTML